MRKYSNIPVRVAYRIVCERVCGGGATIEEFPIEIPYSRYSVYIELSV